MPMAHVEKNHLITKLTNQEIKTQKSNWEGLNQRSGRWVLSPHQWLKEASAEAGLPDVDTMDPAQQMACACAHMVSVYAHTCTWLPVAEENAAGNT